MPFSSWGSCDALSTRSSTETLVEPVALRRAPIPVEFTQPAAGSLLPQGHLSPKQ
jgi:hypothetical protein